MHSLILIRARRCNWKTHCTALCIVVSVCKSYFLVGMCSHQSSGSNIMVRSMAGGVALRRGSGGAQLDRCESVCMARGCVCVCAGW